MRIQAIRNSVFAVESYPVGTMKRNDLHEIHYPARPDELAGPVGRASVNRLASETLQ